MARWLRGTADPKLPELLALIEACSRRSVDFIATVVDPSTLPSVAARWHQLELLREGAHTRPWSHAELRALELEGYRTAGRDPVKYLAQKTGLAPEEVEASLRFLCASGQVRATRSGYRLVRQGVVDTGDSSDRARALRIAWSRSAVERLEKTAVGDVGYSLFAIASRDLRRIRQLQLDVLRQMQVIIAESKNCDCVALYCAQLLDLGETDRGGAQGNRV